MAIWASAAAWAQTPPPGFEAAARSKARGHFVGLISCRMPVIRTQDPLVIDYPAIVQIAVDFGTGAKAAKECFRNMNIRRGMLSVAGWECPSLEKQHCMDEPSAAWTVEQTQKRVPMGKTYMAWKDQDGRAAAMIWDKPADATAMCLSQKKILDGNPHYAKAGAICVNPGKH